ncbi:hypothetical protein PFLmoz3_04459 [Pseudomonas fluorescens]|uniref:Uncharacterized protein n=1 Tax=Pseudomonas fluorescens TaxID=294 RepID=A0A109LEB1_PSEFL|nr:hypothetical protein PFLmoz3_04459 [Pseudomonas fluorescens]
MGVGDEAVFTDIPVPGTHRVGGRQRELQALLGVVLGLEACFGALLQFEGFAASLIGFNGRDQNAGYPAAFIAHRAVGQIQPDFGIAALAVQHKALLAEGAYLAAEHGVVHRRGEAFKLRPSVVRRLAQGAGVLAANQVCKAIVIELREVRAPQQYHRHGRMHDDINGSAQALRPLTGLTEWALRPVQPLDQRSGFATGGCSIHKKP